MKFDHDAVALTAKRLRKSYGIDTNGISDIFSFINQQNIELIRYPFGKNTILGFTAIFEGKKIIVSNSSEILSREIYTIAHELGHIIYDFTDGSSSMKVDKDISSDTISEERAYFFADCLLMPEDKIYEMLRQNFKKNTSDLRAVNLVQMQLEFKVSYNALLERMHSLNLITGSKKMMLYKEREFYTSKKLFKMLGADEALLNPTEKLVVPPQYIDYVISNYENHYIPLSSLKKALSLVNIDTSDLIDDQRTDEEASLDELFGEY